MESWVSSRDHRFHSWSDGQEKEGEINMKCPECGRPVPDLATMIVVVSLFIVFLTIGWMVRDMFLFTDLVEYSMTRLLIHILSFSSLAFLVLGLLVLWSDE